VISSALAEIVAERDAEIAEAERRNAAWFAENPNAATRPYRVPKPFSKATLVRFRAALSSALGDACDSGPIATNPALNVRLRKGKKRHTADVAPVKAWSAADAARFLDAVTPEDHPMTALFHVAVIHGLRRGELCGLRWASVDLDAGTLAVEQIRTTAGYTIVEGDPKSEHPRDTIALDGGTVEVLRTHCVRQAEQRLQLGEAWAAGDLVFTREGGQPWHPDRVSKMFAAAVRRHGLPEITLHGTRHTAISISITEGVPMPVTSKRARHGDYQMTTRYSHLVGDANREAAETVAGAIARHRKAGPDHDP
jgi:integrase